MDSQNDSKQQIRWFATVPPGSKEPSHGPSRADGGRFFHELWISLVRKYYPGNPPLEDVVPWENLEEGQQQSAIAVYELTQHFVWTVGWPMESLNREQKGQFIHLCSIAQNFKRTQQSDGLNRTNWEHLPEWQRKVYIHLFENIEEFQEVGDIPDYLCNELRYSW